MATLDFSCFAKDGDGPGVVGGLILHLTDFMINSKPGMLPCHNVQSYFISISADIIKAVIRNKEDTSEEIHVQHVSVEMTSESGRRIPAGSFSSKALPLLPLLPCHITGDDRKS